MPDSLEEFIEESIRVCREHGYDPVIFVRMRHDYRTQGKKLEQLVEDLVTSGAIQSGFRRMAELDLLDCTVEAAAERFPERFSPQVREAAAWRLRMAREGVIV